jgi:hypothetical protein
MPPVLRYLRSALLAASVALLLCASPATASDLLDLNATNVQISAHGSTALVTYRAKGATRHVLVWGAINALTPDSGKPQVRFKHDYSGGLKTQHRAVWVSFVNDCGPYDGPKLVYFVTGCKARDGSYWALQRWQRNLPHRGWKPWTSWQRAWELRLSHWVGPLAQVDLYTDWAFNGDAHGIFGRMSYAGKPVHGFHTTSNGEPTDTYGRSLYIDTHDSAYGPGWERETSIVFRKPTGSFCYSFWPTHDVSLPGSPERPAGHGNRYRISVVGPGVTPDVAAEALDPGKWDPTDRTKVAWQKQQLKLFDEVTAGDKFCATQH